ncbi:MAG: hypothetical protein J6K03_04155 [Oscillospiraceae bacterium]|nr:hypothetical protein [Oscillospiraceae bacterium]
MKKWMAVLLSAALMTTMLGGCADPKDPTGSTSDGTTAPNASSPVATLSVVDGVFSQDCVFALDVDRESELQLNDLLKVFLGLIPDEAVRDRLLNASTPAAYYDSRKLYFLTDGTCIIEEVASPDMRIFNKLLDMTKTEEELAAPSYTVGGYRVVPKEDGAGYTVTVSGGTLMTYEYNDIAGIVSGAGNFAQEVYEHTKMQAVPVPGTTGLDYSSIKTGGSIEKKYMGKGSYEVSAVTYRETQAQSYFQYKVWYPSQITQSDEKYPLVIMSNGTGVLCYAYESVFEHLASWGFIVVGNDEGMSNTGIASENSLKRMIAENDDPDSIFYQKVDVENVGSVGHSQGGFGVVNSVTAFENSYRYKAAVVLSCTDTTLANGLGWYADSSKINVPFMIMGSTGQTDAGIASLAGMQALYDNISDDVPKLLARRNDGDHGEMLYYANGYVTAWLCYWLKGDQEAGKAFLGTDAEIAKNSLYQDYISNLGE